MNTNAISIDEYIDSKRSAFSAEQFRQLGSCSSALRAKIELARERRHDRLVRGIERLLVVLESDQQLSDPLPRHMAEAGVAAAYLLKGVDIIPDSIPQIGLADDEWIVSRVLERNPELVG